LTESQSIRGADSIVCTGDAAGRLWSRLGGRLSTRTHTCVTRVALRTRWVRLLTEPASRRNHTSTVSASRARLRQARVAIKRAVVLARLAVHTPVQRLTTELIRRTRACVCPSCDRRLCARVGTAATVLARAGRTSCSTRTHTCGRLWSRLRTDRRWWLCARITSLRRYVGEMQLRQHCVHGHAKTG
jgi:hypothetical protein